MTEADVSGFVMEVVSSRNSRYTLQRDVPVIRLKSDAELRVWSDDTRSFHNLMFCGAVASRVTYTHV